LTGQRNASNWPSAEATACTSKDGKLWSAQLKLDVVGLWLELTDEQYAKLKKG